MNLERQRRAPLWEALLRHQNKAKGNFHVPGHKQGHAFDQQAFVWFKQILDLDLTEVGELDDLHDPQGVISEAQQLAAEAFQADHTLFLVGGTSVGNLAVVFSLCFSGQTMLVQRSCHQSVFNGMMLAGGKAVLYSCRTRFKYRIREARST